MSGDPLERLRWWHIDEVLAIEADLFGAGAVERRRCSGTSWPTATTTSPPSTAAEPSSATPGWRWSRRARRWVNNIAVRRDRQRRGIGRVLLDALLADARRTRARAGAAGGAADNEAAQRLYDALRLRGDRRAPRLLPAEQHRRPGDAGVTSS